MPSADRSLVRLLVAVCVLPHELGHAVPARLAGLDARITVLPDWEGQAVPLARFNAPLEQTTPLWVVRLVAVGPLLTYLAVAGVVGVVTPPDPAVTVPLLVALSFWAGLSQGDLAVAATPEVAREAGEFLAPPTQATVTATLLLTPATVVGVGLLLLR